MKIQIFLLLTVILLPSASSVFAHKTVIVDQYQVEVGWRDEPPLVNQQNAIVFSITTEEEGIHSGVINAFKNLSATIKSGSVEKQLDILSDTKAGHYYSRIIPTQVGSLTIDLKGTINDVEVNEQIEIEDVENINVIAFPPTDVSGLPDLAKIKNSLSSLQQEISQINEGKLSNNTNSGKSYDYAMLAMSLSTAGVILAVIAMIKRK